MPWKREKVVLRRSWILELGSKKALDNNTDNKFASTVKQIDIKSDCQYGYCSFGKAFAWLRRGVLVACCVSSLLWWLAFSVCGPETRTSFCTTRPATLCWHAQVTTCWCSFDRITVIRASPLIGFPLQRWCVLECCAWRRLPADRTPDVLLDDLRYACLLLTVWWWLG